MANGCRRLVLNTAIIICSSLAVAIPLCAIKKIPTNVLKLFGKIFAIALFTFGTVRCFLNDNFVWIINGGNYGEQYYQTSDHGHAVLRWLTYLGFSVYPCAFFLNNRTLKNFAVYFCTPVAIVASFFYGDFLSYFIAPSYRAIYAPQYIRHIEFSGELILSIAMGIMLRFGLGHKFDLKSKKEIKYFAVMLPITLVSVFPVYLPQALFGFSRLHMQPLSLQHFVWLSLLLAIFAVAYFILRFRPFEQRYAVCVFLSLYLVMHYNSIYLMDLKLSRLPFQLCNLGSYLVLIALIIRKQPFSNFVMIANVPGTIIALFVPDVREGMLSFWNIHYYIEHMLVFLIPMLMVTLRICERPDNRAIKHFFIGFSIYFVFCAVIGSLFNGYLFKPGDPFYTEVNYFFMFDDKISTVLMFMKFTYNFPVSINGYLIYPLYMALVYVLFSFFCMAMFWGYKKLCKVGDEHFKLRLIRIGLYRERHPNTKKFFHEKYID